IALLCLAVPAWGLQPDQIALIVNDQSPGSRELADFYARQRHIPEGRIIAISVGQPDAAHPREEISASDYEPMIAGPVRAYLEQHGWKDKVTCLVSFWGVPLRVGQRSNTPEEAAELATIDKERGTLGPRVTKAVAAIEAIAAQVRPGYAPTTQIGSGD